MQTLKHWVSQWRGIPRYETDSRITIKRLFRRQYTDFTNFLLSYDEALRQWVKSTAKAAGFILSSLIALLDNSEILRAWSGEDWETWGYPLVLSQTIMGQKQFKIRGCIFGNKIWVCMYKQFCISCWPSKIKLLSV